MTTARFFSVRYETGDDQHASFAELTRRWVEDAQLRERVVHAIRGNEELPADLPMLKFRTLHGEVNLVDLRGIDLSEEKIGAVDLSYCCFDFASFAGAHFKGTHFQFSSFAFATFNRTHWSGVQASPISAPRASLTGAVIEKTFLMRSDLEGADLSGCSLLASRLTDSNLRGAVLSVDGGIDGVDIAGVLLTQSTETRAWADSAGLRGKPVWDQDLTTQAETTISATFIDDFLIPHFDLDLLKDLKLAGHQPEKTQPSRKAWSAPPGTGKGTRYRVLVVDDSPTALEASAKLLSKTGVEVTLARSGLQAIALISQDRPDLVLMDIEMPGMSGIEAVRKLREEEIAPRLPIIMMSSQPEKYDYQVLTAGVQGFVAKQSGFRDLVEKVKQWLPPNEARASSV